MIEAVDVCPGLCGVAGFAAEGCAVGAPASHAIVELTFVGILVTGGAGAIFKMERKNFVCASTEADLVAISAGNRDVSAGQRKFSGFVLGDGEGGAMEIDHGVAGFTPIVVGSGSELIVMRIFVAIRASGEFHFVDGVLAGGDVALRAFDGDVLAF